MYSISPYGKEGKYFMLMPLYYNLFSYDIRHMRNECHAYVHYTVDSRYLEFQGTYWNTSRYPYLDISDLQNWGKNNSNNHI